MIKNSFVDLRKRNMLMNKLRFLLTLILTISILYTTLPAQESAVTIDEYDSHFRITLDYSSGLSRYEMGQLEMEKILQALPEYESLIDSYIYQILNYEFYYEFFISNMKNIKPQVQQEFIEEIDGMITKLSGDTTNGFGDGKLSADEFYLIQLITDACRQAQCSAVSVFGSRSATGNTITARLLDWDAGPENQLAQIQAVITVNNGDKSLCSIGYLGFVGILTAFNDDGVFASVLDSPTKAKYSSTKKNSYVMDLRYALENETTLDGVANILKDSERNYAFNHLIFLSDENTSKVLENNFSGTGTDMKRALRSDISELNPNVTWELENAIGAVNSFVLDGNHDNHTTKAENYERWNSIKTQLELCGETVSLEEIKQIASFSNGDGPLVESDNELYHSGNQQIIIFQPDVPHLEVAFRPKTGELPDDPNFEIIPITLDYNTTDVKSSQELPETFKLYQNYPNPFNPNTTINYSIPTVETGRAQSLQVQLLVYDLLGRNVKTLVNKQQSAGSYSVNFDASELPSGVYVYKLTAGSFTDSKKLMLLK